MSKCKCSSISYCSGAMPLQRLKRSIAFKEPLISPNFLMLCNAYSEQEGVKLQRELS